MDTVLAAFVLFLLAVTAMAVGVLVKGKRLSGSCGGRGPDGRPLADCLCARENRPTCDSAPSESVGAPSESVGAPSESLGPAELVGTQSERD